MQLCDATAERPKDLVVEALDGRLTLGNGALPLRQLVGALPQHPALSMEIRSAVLRRRFRDPVDRARHVLTTTLDHLER